MAGADYENALVATALDFSAMRRIETTLYRTNTQHYAGRFHNRSPAAYLQDGWRVTDRLTLNAGLRWSGQFFTGASGRVVQEIP